MILKNSKILVMFFKINKKILNKKLTFPKLREKINLHFTTRIKIKIL